MNGHISAYTRHFDKEKKNATSGEPELKGSRKQESGRHLFTLGGHGNNVGKEKNKNKTG